MAEETLVKEPLTREMIEAGGQLLERLQATDLEIVGMFWLYSSESNRWHLTLVSPQVADQGAREVYGKIWDVLYGAADRVDGLDLADITILDPKEKLVRALASVNALAPNALTNRRLPHSNLNGVYV